VKKFIARKPEKEVISLRISSDILKTIDNKSAEIGISRNELINQMIQYSLDNMDDTSDES
jgi:metal-responsive CopG/Arc/MetJ family transcriptional regulator